MTPSLRPSKAPRNPMRLDWKDIVLRTLSLAAGSVAAALLVMKGQASALPALAIGATLGTLMMARTGTTEK